MFKWKYLKISSKNKRVGFSILCSKCKGSPNGGICVSKNSEDRNGKYCKTPEKHSYRVGFHKSGTKSGKRTKQLNTRDEQEAAKKAYDEYNFFKQHGCFIDDVQENKAIVENKPESLFDWIQAFIAFKVKPTRNRIPITKGTLRDYTLHLDILVEALFEKGINSKLIEVKDLKKYVETVFDFINKKTKDGTTHAKYFKTYRAFWNYLVKEEDLQLPSNPFNNWHFNKKHLKNEIIYEEEFQALLESIDTLPAMERLKGKIRRRHFSWLKYAFRLGLTMGIRRQEVPIVKWNGIHLNRVTQELFGGIIEVLDIKLSKRHAQDIYKYISINMDLADLLIEMGYEKFKDQNKYIIDSEEEFTREHIKNCLSNSFAYYIRPLGIKRELSFECLRKTYATFSKSAGGEEFSKDITQHTNKDVMKNHYWNKFEAARTHEVYPRIFPKK